MHKNEYELELKERESEGTEITMNQRVITGNKIHKSSVSILSSGDDYVHNINAMLKMETMLNFMGKTEAKYDAIVEALYEFKANGDWSHDSMVSLIRCLCCMNDI